ncbi:hypothetical protein [Pectinatus sottacetonis]|uniref:hypothetical protein n=1 Tax=Pectinatus sottacetonis TaxID=1002795 RepID=UPI0018C49E75|nr:hypothetical protein [Pectinatus sottacetonis]
MKNFHVNVEGESFELSVVNEQALKKRQFNVIVDNTSFNLDVIYQEHPPFFRLAKMPMWSFSRNEHAAPSLRKRMTKCR